MPRRAIPAAGGAISTGKANVRSGDNKLLRLEAEFNAASDREDKATARLDALETELERLQEKVREAEAEEHRWTDEIERLLEEVMRARAKSIEGMLVKARVRKRYKCDDEAREGQMLDSIVKDLKRMARKA